MYTSRLENLSLGVDVPQFVNPWFRIRG